MNDSSFKDLLFVLFQVFFSKFSEPHGKKSWNFIIRMGENMLANQKKVFYESSILLSINLSNIL